MYIQNFWLKNELKILKKNYHTNYCVLEQKCDLFYDETSYVMRNENFFVPNVMHFCIVVTNCSWKTIKVNYKTDVKKSLEVSKLTYKFNQETHLKRVIYLDEVIIV